MLLSTYAHDFMSTRVFGNVNVGLLLGLAQFVTTFVITHLYVAHANKQTDPIADEMRERLEAHEFAPRRPADRSRGHRGGHPCLTSPPAGRDQRRRSATRRSTSRSSPCSSPITLFITFRASRNNKSAADYYAAGRNISGTQNGLAIAGDYLSAASFLGIAGAIAVYGYDGFLYSIGFLVAWLVALLLVAELMRNTARYTMADVLAFRMRQRPVRMAAAISTLAVSLFYLLAQMAGAGGLVTLLLGVSGEAAQAVVVTIVGALMIFYVLVGGMRGTTYVQIIKASLLIIGAFVMTLWVLGKYGFNLSALLGGAAESRPRRRRRATSSRPARSTGRPASPSWTSSRWAWPWCSGRRGCRTC